MRKATLLATALVFAGANLAYAVPAPLGAGPGLSGSDGSVTLVRDTKAKKSKKAKKSSKSGGGGMNMPGMPPGHKM